MFSLRTEYYITEVRLSSQCIL